MTDITTTSRPAERRVACGWCGEPLASHPADARFYCQRMLDAVGRERRSHSNPADWATVGSESTTETLEGTP